MRITLGPFARSGIESYFGPDLPAGVQMAMMHYARKLKVGRVPLAPPGFLDAQVPREDEVVLNLSIDAEVESVLEDQALSQGLTMSRLAVHAVMLYLAELEFLGVAPHAGV